MPVPFQLTVSSFGLSSNGQGGFGTSCWPWTSEKRAVEVTAVRWQMTITSPNRGEESMS